MAEQKRHKAKTAAFLATATFLTVALGALVGGKSYIATSTLLIIYSMIPFFSSFEQKKPQAQEIAILSVMIALAVISRAAFAFVPNLKPMAAIVMITGITFGASPGFLVGALSALISNFMFGQGPWTPWQMLSFGLCGLIFGLLAERGILKRKTLSRKDRLIMSTLGAVFIIAIAGPILDTSSLFFMISNINATSAAAVYLAGFPMNCIHGGATFITLFLLANPILDKLSRLREKYGMLQI